ncbi:MAG: hypothetical protein V3V71_07190 [Roseateles sp.]|jgi:hypothetical protein|nr:hypothetical protein [Methylibium sp.]MBY0365013.1 hypothetical protein [Burkholderiaceae bacterium]|mmetsp:Transcript_22768/g.37493  ORF Transcript_22768/g.37493 Transcript_22768/m.37493 type:complete len:143 (-) Transcript_22768:203-631(-)
MEDRFIEPTFGGRLKLGVCALAGFALSVAMDFWWPPFMGYVRALPICESLPWLMGVFLTFVGLCWLAGLSVFRAALLTLRSGQTPFPGAWIWSRTKVRTGWRARLDGYAFVLLAVAAFVAPLFAAYVLDVQDIFCMHGSCGC